MKTENQPLYASLAMHEVKTLLANIEVKFEPTADHFKLIEPYFVNIINREQFKSAVTEFGIHALTTVMNNPIELLQKIQALESDERGLAAVA